MTFKRSLATVAALSFALWLAVCLVHFDPTVHAQGQNFGNNATGLQFGSTQVPTGTTAPTTGQYLFYNGTALVPDPGVTTNGTGTLTLGAVGVGAGTDTLMGSTSGSVSIGCVPTTTCLAFGNANTGMQFKGYQTGTNCAGTGTAANPSVVTCTSAAAGAFACSTSASTGTCQVNTSAVTTNSEIILQPTSVSNGLTCNATADTGLTAPRLASQSNGANFVINLGTFSGTALCFKYWIIN